MTEATNAGGVISDTLMGVYQYEADTQQFTVFARRYVREPLATVTVSMADSHKLMRAIDRIYKDAREGGISHACAAMDNLTEELMR